MTSKHRITLITITFGYSFIAAISPLSSQAAGPAVGLSDSKSVNTILNGKSSPLATVGKNGDFYIDIQNLVFYGPKKNGLWPVGISLKGTNGKDGVDGKNESREWSRMHTKFKQ